MSKAMNVGLLFQNDSTSARVYPALGSLPIWARGFLFGIGYFVSAEIGAFLFPAQDGLLPFWPPCGLALAVFLLSDNRDLRSLVPALCAGNYAADMIHGRAIAPSLLYMVVNCIEPLLGAWLIKRYLSGRVKFQSAKEVLAVTLIGAIGAPAAGATLATLLVVPIVGGGFLAHWLSWWTASLLGVILVAPVCLIWSQNGLLKLARLPRRQAAEALMLILMAAAAAALIFGQQRYFPATQEYLLIPLLVWTALRFGLPGAAITGALVSLIAVWGVGQTQAMLAPNGTVAHHQVSYLQVFLGVSQFTALILAAVLEERRRAERETEIYAERLKTLYEIAQAILSSRSADSMAQVALAHLRRLIPCKEASITEFDFRGRHARRLAIETEEKPPVGTGSRLPVQFFEIEHLQGRKVHHVQNIQSLPDKDTMLSTMLASDLNSLLRIPLVVRDELIGSLNLGSDHNAAFLPDHIEVANEIAVLLALGMRHAMLYEQTDADAQTKAVLLKEVNHRVKNNLSAIIGLLYAESNRAEIRSPDSYRRRARGLINRIQGLATVHDMLSAAEWKPLRLSELAKEIADSALKAAPVGRKITVEVQPSAVLVMPDQAHNLALVLNELTTNAVKYALRPHGNLHIKIGIMLDNHRVRLEYRDNGPGFPDGILKDDNPEYSVGFDIIKNIIQKALHGRFSLLNDKGAVAVMEFDSKLN